MHYHDSFSGWQVDGCHTDLKKSASPIHHAVIGDPYAEMESKADGLGSHYSQRQACKRWT
jgi:hypothetical protein